MVHCGEASVEVERVVWNDRAEHIHQRHRVSGGQVLEDLHAAGAAVVVGDGGERQRVVHLEAKLVGLAGRLAEDRTVAQRVTVRGSTCEPVTKSKDTHQASSDPASGGRR